LRASGSAGGDDCDADLAGHCGRQLAVKAGAGSVTVHGGQQDFSCSALLGFAGPLQGLFRGWLASAGYPDFRRANFTRAAPGVNGHNHCLGAKAGCDLADQTRIGNGRRVDADLVGARVKDAGGIGQGPNASAHSEGNKELAGRLPDGLYQGLAPLGGGGNVEQDDLIGARFGMDPGQLRRIASIAQLFELNAFDHTPGIYIQASDDALGKLLRWHRSFPESLILLVPIFPDGIVLQRYCCAPPPRRTRRHIESTPPSAQLQEREMSACNREMRRPECRATAGIPDAARSCSNRREATLRSLGIWSIVRKKKRRRVLPGLRCCPQRATACPRKSPGKVCRERWLPTRR